MNRLGSFATEADQDVTSHVGMAGEAGESAIELAMVRAVILNRATLFVDDWHKRKAATGE